MPITIDGDGTITGVSVGGLPDGIVDTDMIAADAVTDAKQNLSGAAKAWINFSGSGTAGINDSFNVASLTDNGTGDYTITFSNNLGNENYAVVTSPAVPSDQGEGYSFGVRFTGGPDSGSPTTKTTSAIRLMSRRSSDVDIANASVAVFGD